MTETALCDEPGMMLCCNEMVIAFETSEEQFYFLITVSRGDLTQVTYFEVYLERFLCGAGLKQFRISHFVSGGEREGQAHDLSVTGWPLGATRGSY